MDAIYWAAPLILIVIVVIIAVLAEVWARSNQAWLFRKILASRTQRHVTTMEVRNCENGVGYIAKYFSSLKALLLLTEGESYTYDSLFKLFRQFGASDGCITSYVNTLVEGSILDYTVSLYIELPPIERVQITTRGYWSGLFMRIREFACERRLSRMGMDTRKTLAADQPSIFYLYRNVNPSGPVFVFLHGVNPSLCEFEVYMRTLQEDMSMFVPTMPSILNTQTSKQFTSYATYARELVKQLDAIFPNQMLVLVGFETGAMVAMEIKAMQPDKVAGLYFVDPTFGINDYAQIQYILGASTLPQVKDRVDKQLFSDYNLSWSQLVNERADIHNVGWLAHMYYLCGSLNVWAWPETLSGPNVFIVYDEKSVKAAAPYAADFWDSTRSLTKLDQNSVQTQNRGYVVLNNAIHGSALTSDVGSSLFYFYVDKMLQS